jgi:hypothetical protein
MEALPSMKRQPRPIAASVAPVRRLMLLAVLMAFSLQAYFVQTHLHGQPSAKAGQTQITSATVPNPSLPTDPMDPATCKLCKELVYAGAAVTPAGPDFLLLLEWVALAVPVSQLPAARLMPEPGWQSRAPPRG